VNYSITGIKKLLKEQKKEADKQKMFSKDVIDAIITRFPENATYKEDELFDGFKEIFQNYGIEAKVNIPTIGKYYGADKLKGKNTGLVKIYSFIPNFEFD